MTAGKWCYHPWTGNPVDHDFNTKKWCVTVTLQNIKKKYLQSSKHMGLSKTGPPRNWVGYHRVPHWDEHFWATLISGQTYISTIHGKTLMFDTQLGKNTWPHASPLVPPNKMQFHLDPNSIPIGTVFFWVKAPVSFWNLASSFSRKSFGDSESSDFWEVAIHSHKPCTNWPWLKASYR